MAVRSSKTHEMEGFWRNGTLCSALQEDGNSCGAFVLLVRLHGHNFVPLCNILGLFIAKNFIWTTLKGIFLNI